MGQKGGAWLVAVALPCNTNLALRIPVPMSAYLTALCMMASHCTPEHTHTHTDLHVVIQSTWADPADGDHESHTLYNHIPRMWKGLFKQGKNNGPQDNITAWVFNIYSLVGCIHYELWRNSLLPLSHNGHNETAGNPSSQLFPKSNFCGFFYLALLKRTIQGHADSYYSEICLRHVFQVSKQDKVHLELVILAWKTDSKRYQPCSDKIL